MSLPDCILLKISNLEDIAIEAIQDEYEMRVGEEKNSISMSGGITGRCV